MVATSGVGARPTACIASRRAAYISLVTRGAVNPVSSPVLQVTRSKSFPHSRLATSLSRGRYRDAA